MSDPAEREVNEEAAAYEPSADDYFQAQQAGFSDPQAQFLLRRFGQPTSDPTTIALLMQIQARLDRVETRLDQQQETNVEILTRLSRLEAQREADREQYQRDREADRLERQRDREEFLRQFTELRQDYRTMDERLTRVETGLTELRADVHHLQERTLFENRGGRAVVSLAIAAGAVIGGVLAFWK